MVRARKRKRTHPGPYSSSLLSFSHCWLWDHAVIISGLRPTHPPSWNFKPVWPLLIKRGFQKEDWFERRRTSKVQKSFALPNLIAIDTERKLRFSRERERKRSFVSAPTFATKTNQQIAANRGAPVFCESNVMRQEIIGVEKKEKKKSA